MSLLADLVQLGEELGDRLLPEGFRRSHVQLLIHIDADGRIESVGYEPDTKLGQRLIPDSSRTSGNAAHPIADKFEYVASFPQGDSGKDGERAAARHTNYVSVLDSVSADLASDVERAALQAILAAIADPNELVERVKAAVGVEPKTGWSEMAAWFTDFVVAGKPTFESYGGATSLEEVAGWWSTQQQDANAASDDLIVCQVTGRPGRPARLFPATKLPGNQPRLVATNFPSAWRYGADQATGSGVTTETASLATRAVNFLVGLGAADHRVRLGDDHALLWAVDDVDFQASSFLDSGDPVQDLVDRLRTGIWNGHPNLDADAPLNAAILAVNSARIVVRAEHRATLGEFQDQLINWYESMSPVVSASPMARLGIFQLSEAVVGADAVRKPGTNAALAQALARAATMLFRSALTGATLPASIRNHTLERCRVGSVQRTGQRVHVTDAQAAVLLLARSRTRELYFMNKQADLCGRVFAELERIQRDALGDTNSGVAGSYAAAAATPELTFSRLLAKRPTHCRKLFRDPKTRGMAVNSDKRLETLMSALLSEGGFPRFLDPAGQADFALGYYDQRAKRFQKLGTSDTEPTQSQETVK